MAKRRQHAENGVGSRRPQSSAPARRATTPPAPGETAVAARALDAEAIARERQTDGIFPLVTNDPDLTSLAVLHSYKRQPQIEKRFEQLQTDFAVAPVFLKDVGRVEALFGVYFVVLLVEALLERELRQAMARDGIESLPLYPEGRPCRRPTTRRLIDLFEPIQRHTLQQGARAPITAINELSSLQRKLLRLLEVPGTLYTC